MNLNEKIKNINKFTNEIINKQKEIEDLVSKRSDTYHEISNFIKENCKNEILKSRKIYTINQDPDEGACLSENHKFDLCENCYDKIVSQFVYPVENKEYKELI